MPCPSQHWQSSLDSLCRPSLQNRLSCRHSKEKKTLLRLISVAHVRGLGSLLIIFYSIPRFLVLCVVSFLIELVWLGPCPKEQQTFLTLGAVQLAAHKLQQCKRWFLLTSYGVFGEKIMISLFVSPFRQLFLLYIQYTWIGPFVLFNEVLLLIKS